jgi:hypothetical protein
MDSKNRFLLAADALINLLLGILLLLLPAGLLEFLGLPPRIPSSTPPFWAV